MVYSHSRAGFSGKYRKDEFVFSIHGHWYASGLRREPSDMVGPAYRRFLSLDETHCPCIPRPVSQQQSDLFFLTFSADNEDLKKIMTGIDCSASGKHARWFTVIVELVLVESIEKTNSSFRYTAIGTLQGYVENPQIWLVLLIDDF